ncbi:MAG: type I DNA topoisomerase [Deltaproteobacteria bacterium]|nr:type I DNA topoisomerase [Deltaproteobacteria bacterium]
MAKNLLIVESPAKAKTIKKYLGPDFKTMASVGHVKDLPVKRLGVNIEDGFKPEYVTIKGKAKILKDLKAAAKTVETIYLAPDPDREGEAIAWHIAKELENGGKKIYRVLFNELTARAIRAAVESPLELDLNKYRSQQARRILDRLVGYQLSPLLWTKVKRGLSAGRVQSVSVRMICDREREIQAFEPREYWSLTAHLKSEEPPPFIAKLLRYEGKKIDLETGAQTRDIVSAVETKPFDVAKVAKRKQKRNPPPPFTTSLLQQEASRRLGFSAKRTMAVAQGLYEGVELGGRGQVGLITYMRTDSFRLSAEAVSEARAFIDNTYSADYVPAKPNAFKSRKGSQEAHEAIRPTSVDLTPESVAGYLGKDQLNLYRLIWKRFVACQMSPAVLHQTQVEIAVGKAIFKASGSVVVFKGFTVLYEETTGNGGDKGGEDAQLPPLEKGQRLDLVKLEPAQHFTQPPPRYSEATLIKALEENGIGRPSTYAAILSNISNREYVVLEKKRFKPTELGFLVTDLLVGSFPDVMNTAFTAQMESNLDKIERGQVAWTRVMGDFYNAFREDLERAEKEMKGEVLTEIACPECGRLMGVKSGKNGVFLACTGFPECKHTTNFYRDEKGRIVAEKPPEIQEDAAPCESCGRPMVAKNGRFGPFLACTGYPECRSTRPLDAGGDENKGLGPTDIQCKVCGGTMMVKVNKSGQRFLACGNYPKCTHTEPLSTRVPCPNKGCDGMLVEKSSKQGRVFYACDQYPGCRFAMWDEPFDDACPECGSPVLGIKRPKGDDPFLKCRKKGCGFKKSLPSVAADIEN